MRFTATRTSSRLGSLAISAGRASSWFHESCSFTWQHRDDEKWSGDEHGRRDREAGKIQGAEKPVQG